jgi:hypothetical protein
MQFGRRRRRCNRRKSSYRRHARSADFRFAIDKQRLSLNFYIIGRCVSKFCHIAEHNQGLEFYRALRRSNANDHQNSSFCHCARTLGSRLCRNHTSGRRPIG